VFSGHPQWKQWKEITADLRLESGDEEEIFYHGAQFFTTEVPAPDWLFHAGVPVPIEGDVSRVNIVIDFPASSIESELLEAVRDGSTGADDTGTPEKAGDGRRR
jgi:hypothetical protein